ncbi:MAG: hypothetical protein WCV93_00630 [Candidatus Shapirobacteria bacterium]|jgi:hypothetical protein
MPHTVDQNTKPGTRDALRRAFVTELEPADRDTVTAVGARLTDRLLRDRPLTQRAHLVQQIARHTIYRLSWEDGRDASAGSIVKDSLGLFPNDIDIPRGGFDEPVLAHEDTHYLQETGILPLNNALTYTVNRLLEIESGSRPFVDHDNGDRILTAAVTPEAYLEAVLSGRAADYLIAPWILGPEETNDPLLRRFATYLQHESDFNAMFAQRGELNIGEFLGDPNPYQTMANVGSARANRAFAVGYFTNNPENAWTVLWLHSQGMAFEVAEKTVVTAYLKNELDKFNYQPLDPTKVAEMAQYEELFGDIKLSKDELIGLEEQQAKINLPTRLRKLLHQGQNSLAFVRDLIRSFQRIQSEPDPENLATSRQIFDEWSAPHCVVNTATGGRFLDLSEIQPHADHLNQVAQDSGQEWAANIMIFPGKTNIPTAYVVGARAGSAFCSLPRVYSQPIKERVGLIHTHQVADFCGHGLADLFNFLSDPFIFLSVVRSTDGIYALVKPGPNEIKPPTISARFRLAKQVLKQISQGANEPEVIVEVAKSMGVIVYKKNGLDADTTLLLEET